MILEKIFRHGTPLTNRKMTSHCRLQTPQEIEQHANQIVGDFLLYITSDKLPLTEWVFSQETEPLRSRRTGGIGRPIRAVTKKGVLELQICPNDLLGITYIALQGWLELEIARSTEEAKADSCQFNFQNQIRPLMYLAGSGLYFIRELVEYLSRSLIRRETTKIIHRMGRGLPQVYYYFHTLNFSEEEKKFYTNFTPHKWSRASHLCGKLVEYMGLSYLADHGVGFSQTLCLDWQKQHGYLSEDQAFLDEMVSIANQFADQAFSFQLIEMFKVLRDTMLLNNSSVVRPPEPGIN